MPEAPAAADVVRRSIACGGARSCLIEDGGVWCWGGGSSDPRRVEGLDGAVSVAVADSRTCVIDAAGTLACTVPRWDGTPGEPAEIERFDGLGPLTDVALGVDHTCALGRPARCRAGGTTRAEPSA
jgi:alpha-tubulin suppressor-like RCC1 family protein